MSELNDNELQTQLALLKRMYERGRISEDDYHAELADLGVTPTAVFDQSGQRFERQVNVAGDYIDQRQVAVEPGAGPESLRRAYLHRVARQTYRLPLTGVDPKTARDQGSSELQLSAVYTALLTQRPETVEIDRAVQEQYPERMAREARRLSALGVLDREPRLALLGGPGSGKSTFVNFVALCLAGEGLGYADANLAVLAAPLPVEERGIKKKYEEFWPQRPQPWSHGPLLPVRIVLRDLAARGLPAPGQRADGDTLWAFIVGELGQTLQEYATYLKAELLERGGLILLDGLDEVPDAHQRREQVKQAVQGFSDSFPHCRFLVTSRTYAYQRQDWKLEDFSEAVLSPFTPGQIVRFVDGWYAHVGQVRGLDPADAQGRAALLKTAIERSERLAELAAHPLLLTLMASLHAWRGGSLPEKREELYADAVDLLLDQWESPKVVRDAAGRPLVHQPSLAEWLKVDRALVRAELNRLAFEAHRDQPRPVGAADVPQEQLVSGLMRVARNPDVNPARLIEYVRDRAGLLAARGEGVYAFPHRTFQEYLAACHLTDHGFPDDLAELLRADPQRWREATLLAGAKAARGTSSAAWNLAEALCYRDPPLEGVGQDVVLPHCWGALLAARTLLENEGKRLAEVSERNAPKRERIRRWLLAIVTRGWLSPVDRALAGEALAFLGDDRDFDELVEIPTGPFLMGDDSDPDARPQREVTLPSFKIGKYPVTNAQYLCFLETTGRRWRSDNGRRPERANCPATSVSYHSAKDYCAWLTDVWRTEDRITTAEAVRLPTEAEWEKAARGTDGRSWPWGDEWIEGNCNTAELGLGTACAVGIFPDGASPYGCLDMAGQVWEWTTGSWGMGTLRAVRGGSFHHQRGHALCASRNRDHPDYGVRYNGFRVVVSENRK
jgi:formylglycine-generating enzyme required for sulfatase activity